MFDFGAKARAVFVEAGERKGKNYIRAITPVGISTIIKLTWKPFKVQFGDIKTKLGECMVKIDHEVDLAEKEEAHAERVRAREERVVQGTHWEETTKFHSNWQSKVEDSEIEKITKWLAPANAASNHSSAKNLRYGTTGSWFLEGDAFGDWINDTGHDAHSRLFWLHAIPGAGKTILASSIINHLKQFHSDEVGLAYFYCDYKEPMKQEPSVVLRTLLSQLSTHNPTVSKNIETLYNEQRKDDRTTSLAPPSLDLIRSNFGSLLESSFRKVYIVIDALDECQELDCILKAILAIVDSLTKVKILVTSREDPLIRDEFTDFPNLRVKAKHVSEDIVDYVNFKLNDRISSKKLKVKDDGLRKQISETLVVKAEGMFQWINCQIDHLCKCKTPNAIRAALNTLPQDLEGTYLRILESIDEVHIEDVQKLLKWLVRGTRELTLKELASAIAIDPHSKNENMDPDDQMEPGDIVDLCSSLLNVSDDNQVSLAHFTVKEFLTSSRIKEKLSLFYIGEEEVHAELSEVCITYLNYRDFDRSPLASTEEMKSFLEEFNFLEYASKSWAIHAHLVSTSENLIHGLIGQLFHSSSSNRFNYDLWLQIYHLQHRRNTLSLIPPSHATPLYYASFFGLPKIVESLLDEGAESLIDSDKTEDPLSASSSEGHADVVDILLRRCFEGSSREKLGRYLYMAASKGNEGAVEVLLKWGAPIDSKVGKYGTALQAAALEGHPATVNVLLQRGANFQVIDPRFGTPLAAAAEKGHRRVTQILLDAGASINGRGGWYSTPLISAIVGKDDITIHKILDNGADVNIQGGRHGCALMAAAAIGKIDLVKRLIDLGAKVNDENDKGADALHSASCAGRLDVVELLIASGADVNAKGGKHRNALNAASAEGHLAIVQSLLANGADPQSTDPHYGNCLQAAAFHGYKDIVRVLAAAGVNVHASGGVRGTALVNASSSGDIEMVDLIFELGVPTGNTQDMSDALAIATRKQDEILMKHILELGAEINSLGQIRLEKWTALSVASFKGNLTLVEMLLKLGANVNSDAGVHGTALIAAISTDHCNHNVVRALIAAGANINHAVIGASGRPDSALNAAIERADMEALNILLENGTDVNLVNGNHSTALMLAVHKRNESIMNILIEHGADVNLTINPCLDLEIDNGCITALDAAVLRGYINLIHRLVESGAALVQPRDDVVFKTSLQCAAFYGRKEAVELLIQLGTDVQIVGGLFGSALQAAACSGSKDCIAALLDAGANINEHHIGMVSCALSKHKTFPMIAKFMEQNGSALIAASSDYQRYGAFEMLLERGVDPNINAGGEFPYAIITMAFQDNIDGVRALIKAGADVKKHGGKYHSAIQASAMSVGGEIVEVLLDAGADINACGGLYGTALECAYRDGYYQFVWALYRRGASHAINGGMWGSALGSAINGACHTLVRQLVERHKVNVNQSCGKWGSPLHFLICERSYDEEELVNVFLDANADVNTLGGIYSTPLGAAIVDGEPGVFERLLEKGADPNLVCPKSGRGPLLLACRVQKEDHVNQLIGRGADVNACTKRGSVLQNAAFRSKGDAQSFRIFDRLLSSGAELNAITKGPYGTTLHAAALAGSFETVEWLLEHGADLHLIAGPFGSVLQAAACSCGQSLKITRLLLNHGAEVDNVGGRYTTALQAASAGGHARTVKLLLNHGADPNIKGGKYGTALQAACIAKNTALVRLLLSKGANPKIAGGYFGNAFTAAVMVRDEEVVRVLLAENGVTRDMMGELKAHYQRDVWEEHVEFIDGVLGNAVALKPFDEIEIDIDGKSLGQKLVGEQLEAMKKDLKNGSERDGETQIGVVELVTDMTVLNWLQIEPED